MSGPENFNDGNEAGFRSQNDFGVPFKNDILFIGHQTEFRRNAGEAFGRSDGDYASMVIAGNTFDYPYIHGLALADAGYGFVSASVGALVDGSVKLSDYKTVDLILGKQKTTVTGNGNTGMRFIAFPKKLQDELRSFVGDGGNLIVSGSYIASELNDYRSPDGSSKFLTDILGIKAASASRPYSGRLTTDPRALSTIPSLSLPYSNTLNEKNYIVENPDAIAPSGKHDSKVFISFSDTGAPAGIVTRNGRSHVAVMTVPFESVTDKEKRASLMKGLLDLFKK